MADEIKDCVVIKDDLDVPIQYDVVYKVENGDASKVNNFCVVIMAEDMDDPTDTAEVTTKANVKAKEIKDAWIALLSTVVTNSSVAIDGEVTL